MWVSERFGGVRALTPRLALPLPRSRLPLPLPSRTMAAVADVRMA